MSDTGAVEAWPLVELTPLVGLAVIWTTEEVDEWSAFGNYSSRRQLPTFGLYNFGNRLSTIKTQGAGDRIAKLWRPCGYKYPWLTVVVLDDASPFCTLGAEKAEEVDPPF